jgi:hypothetical protein
MPDFTKDYFCACGCGGVVKVTFTGGFAGTTCRITPCPKAPPYIMAFDVRRSAVLDMIPVDAPALRHRDGLVTFA